MGKLEEAGRQITRKTKMQEAILAYVISGGRVGGHTLVKQVIDSMLGTDFSTAPSRIREVVKTAASRLTQKGLLKFEGGHYSPTLAGEKLFSNWQMSIYQIKRPKKWDNKWRVIIFDIPEKKKKVREQVRQILSMAGFIRLQDSVWVYPYDCEDVIGLMKVDLGVGKHILYMIVDQIEDDRFLRMDFDLIQ